MIKITEMYIDGNVLILKGEDGREYTLGSDVHGDLIQSEIIMFEKKDSELETKPLHEYVEQTDGSVKCSKCGHTSPF